jgi:preprotein translocase subunit SecA
MVKVVVAEGEESFHRKVAYLKEFGAGIGIPDVDQQVLSQVTLAVLDEKWKDHLYDLDLLRNAIQYRAYGQRDPLVEYKKEAYEMFEDLMRDLYATFTERYLKIQVSATAPAPPPPLPPRVMRGPSTDDLFAEPVWGPNGPSSVRPPAAVSSGLGRLGPSRGSVPEVGRNDPCPCGSGKKYKKCHGAAV